MAVIRRNESTMSDHVSATTASHSHTSSGGLLAGLIAMPITGASPTLIQYGGEDMDYINDHVTGSAYETWLYELIGGSSGANNFVVELDSSEAIILGMADWSGTRGIIQSGVEGGGGIASSFSTGNLTNTESTSKCYCHVVTRQGSLSATDGATEVWTSAGAATDQSMFHSLFEHDGNGGNVNFSFDHQPFGRDSIYQLFEVGVGGAGNRALIIFAQLVDLLEDLRSGLIPGQELRQRWGDAMIPRPRLTRVGVFHG